MTGTKLSDAEAIRRLRAILEGLTEAFEGSFTVDEADEDGWWVVSVDPTRREALGFSWIYRGDVIFGLHTHGVRWELQATVEDLNFMEAVIRSVAAGRVHAVLTASSAEVTVTLADGTREKQNNAETLGGCLALLLWPRWGRRVDYLPYR